MKLKLIEQEPEEKIALVINHIAKRHLRSMRKIKTRRDIEFIESEVLIEDNLTSILRQGLWRNGYDTNQTKEYILKLLLVFNFIISEAEKKI